MGVIKSGILGGFQNKVGGVIGTSWKGIAVMKAMPQSVSNPRTNLQIAQREKFKDITLFAAVYLSSLVRPLWNRFAQKMSGYNSFVQANIANWDADGIVDATKFVQSRGKMGETTQVAGAATNSSVEVEVTWSTDITDSYMQATDDIYVTVFNETKNEWSEPRGTNKRSVGSALVLLPSIPALGNVVHCYVSALRADGTVVSDTAHAIVSVTV